MQPELDPDVDDRAPTGDNIIAYDEQHYVAYLCLLDANAEDTNWTEIAQIVLHRDPASDVARTWRCREATLHARNG